MLQQLWSFVMSLARWPDGTVVKVGNSLHTSPGVNGLLCDDQGRLLLDKVGRFLTTDVNDVE